MTTHPAARTLDLIAAISEHSDGLAAAAEGNLDVAVEHCPGWTVADLVAHVFEVHWFWGTIAGQHLQEPPSDDDRPPRPAGAELVAQFRTGAERLVGTLSAADQATRVWTWAPSQQDIAFITRHQVQEAAVHHWDAAQAAGIKLELAHDLAVDAVEEFLTFSVSSITDHPDKPRPSLDGSFALVATDVDASWTVTDDETPGTLRFSRGAPADLPTISGTASDLLLWLYGRVQLAGDDTELIGQFRGLSFTD
jgi:uncharacterized protein (TIGR03083 family)